MKKPSRFVRLSLWFLGVALPLHAVVFEWLTHQISGTMFDPMVTPWHAAMLLSLPVGVGLILLSAEHAKMRVAGLAVASFSLPLVGLICWAIGTNHLFAALKLVIGSWYLLTHLSEWNEILFGDYFASPVATLAYFGPLAGLSVGLGLVVTRRVGRIAPILFLAFIMGAGLVTYLEFRILTLARTISNAYVTLDRNENLVASPQLTTDRAKCLIARLSRPGQQFSSHGCLYAVGPVDVFGPWTYIQHGRLHPVDILHKTQWPTYQKLHEAIWPGETPQPQSWRGLSPWEEWSH